MKQLALAGAILIATVFILAGAASVSTFVERTPVGALLAYLLICGAMIVALSVYGGWVR